MQARFKIFLAATTVFLCGAAQADITVRMNAVDEKGIGKSIGQVAVSETPYGVVFSPSLAGLPQGLHGFHVHENPSCEPKASDGKMVPALAAGGITIQPQASAMACLGVMGISAICPRYS
jgi:Cu-Zn family superoxide dismutase